MEFTEAVVPTTTASFRALSEEARRRYPTNKTAIVAGSFATAMCAAGQGVRGFKFNDVDVYVKSSPTKMRWNNRGKTQCWYQENQQACKMGADCEWHHYHEQGKKPRGKAAEEPSAEE